MAEQEQDPTLLTEEEKSLLMKEWAYGGSPAEQKQTAHSFLHAIATSDDTTKTGFLTDQEVGLPQHSVRTYKKCALIAEKIANNQKIQEYFTARAEIMTATSLSRRGFLAQLAVVQKRQLEDVTKPKRENKGLFKSKEDESTKLPQ